MKHHMMCFQFSSSDRLSGPGCILQNSYDRESNRFYFGLNNCVERGVCGESGVRIVWRGVCGERGVRIVWKGVCGERSVWREGCVERVE